MIYTEKWAFIHIPKTGGLNFIKRLEYQPGVINAHVSLPRHYNHQSLQWWLDHKVLDESQLIFTFVRHPYTRLVSLYNHIVREGKHEVPEFKEFVMEDVLVNITPHNLDYKFNWPQYKSIENDRNIDVKYFKMESELAQVEKIVNFKFTDTTINADSSDGKSFTFEQVYYKHFTDIEVRHNVQKLYKEDFVRFNYVF